MIAFAEKLLCVGNVVRYVGRQMVLLLQHLRFQLGTLRLQLWVRGNGETTSESSAGVSCSREEGSERMEARL